MTATINTELAGLDALELAVDPGPSRAAKIWSIVWPKLGLAIIARGVLAQNGVVLLLGLLSLPFGLIFERLDFGLRQFTNLRHY